MASRVAGSAQWRSSTTSRSGAAVGESLEEPQQGVEQVCLGVVVAVDRALVGQGRERAADSAAISVDRARSRAAGAVRAQGSLGASAAIGAYGRPMPPTATQAPRSTVKPRSTASRSTSLVNRVLPTPASPETSRWVDAPAARALDDRPARSSSCDRPMKTGLTLRPAIGRSYESITGHRPCTWLMVLVADVGAGARRRIVRIRGGRAGRQPAGGSSADAAARGRATRGAAARSVPASRACRRCARGRSWPAVSVVHRWLSFVRVVSTWDEPAPGCAGAHRGDPLSRERATAISRRATTYSSATGRLPPWRSRGAARGA